MVYDRASIDNDAASPSWTLPDLHDSDRRFSTIKLEDLIERITVNTLHI